jgi:hypothetical protein
MHLADHIRPLLRDHDCVIIPDFGGLVADVAPARLQAGRQTFSPPTKLVAFNQALTRNDGLLVDAVSQHLGVSLTQAREFVRQAVGQLRQDLQDHSRTELPGIGVFRRASGRGLAFEYTGTDNLLPASYGLPELVARPVQATNARVAREKRPQPALRSSSTQRGRLARVLPGATVGLVVAAIVLAASYLLPMRADYLPQNWAVSLPSWEWSQPTAPTTASTVTMQEPQQATLAQHGWTNPVVAEPSPAPAELGSSTDEAIETIPAAATTEESLVPVASAATETVAAATLEAPAKGASASAPTVVATPKVIAVTKAAKEEVKKEPVVVAAPKAIIEKPVEAAAKPVAKPAAVTSTTIKSRTGRFYVVAGAFASLASAQQVRAHHGPAARVIMPPRGSRLYRLSVADFADQASAENEARRLRLKAHSTNSHLVFPY